MLNKLALAGIKNRLRDYIVLFSGLIISSAIFYMFMALATNKSFITNNAAGANAKIVFMFGAILLMVITFVYVSYANTFLLSMRKRDYATFMMLGAKSSKISQLIFVETLIIGVVATVIGAVVGVGLTAGVGNALIKMIGVSAGNFSTFYFPAIIDTLIFFIVIFFLAALVNASKMRQTPILELLHSNQTPTRNKAKWGVQLLQTIVGLISLAVGYWAMAAIETLQLLSIPIALVTIVIGSYLLFNAVVIVVINLLKRNVKFANKGLRNFTLSQLSFRVHSYTMILSVVSILFALALGAITVGMNFKNQIPEITSRSATYDVVTHTHNQKMNQLTDQLTGVKSSATYEYKVEDNTVYFIGSEFDKSPMLYPKRDSKGMAINKYEKITPLTLSEKPESYSYEVIRLTNVKNDTANHQMKFVTQSELNQMSGATQELTTYRLKDFEANLTVAKKIQNYENELFSNSGRLSSKYTMYQLYLGLFGGLAFMGYFLGLAFLAMLASTLMFKILTGADYDKGRYHMLNRMGVRPSLLKKSIRSELAVLFGLPAVLGVVHVLFGLQLFKVLLIDPYNGILIPFVAFIVIYLIYYVITVWLYEKIVMTD